MSLKCKLISLGKINKYILLIFSAILFKIGLSQIEGIFIIKSETLNLINISLSIFNSLGLSLSFSLYLIYKKCNKNKNNFQSKQNESYLVLVPKQIKNISKFKKFLWILLISVIDFISNL